MFQKFDHSLTGHVVKLLSPQQRLGNLPATLVTPISVAMVPGDVSLLPLGRARVQQGGGHHPDCPGGRGCQGAVHQDLGNPLPPRLLGQPLPQYGAGDLP